MANGDDKSGEFLMLAGIAVLIAWSAGGWTAAVGMAGIVIIAAVLVNYFGSN